MARKSDLAKDYLAKSTANDVDGALALLAEDVVLRNRPAGMGNLTPAFEEPVEQGDQVQIKGNLPPGSPLPVSSLTWTFSFQEDRISRIEVGT